MSNQWTFMNEVAEDLAKTGVHDLGVGLSTIICDRMIAALSAEDRTGLDEAQAVLERFYLDCLKSSPSAAARAARGEDDGDSSEAAAFSLGQIGFAHAIAARAASKRVDQAFDRRLRSRQLERYVRLLIDEELSGRQIADRVGKDEAEVSRRLKILRQIGAVECRREGNRVVNFLTPAARTVARAHNMGAIGATNTRLAAAVSEALDDHRRELPEEMRQPLVLVFAGDRRAL